MNVRKGCKELFQSINKEEQGINATAKIIRKFVHVIFVLLYRLCSLLTSQQNEQNFL